MRYFEIVRPSTKHIERYGTERNLCGRITQWWYEICWRAATAIRSVVRPGQSAVTSVALITPRNSAGSVLSSQPIAANPLFEGPTDFLRCLLPVGIR